MKSILFPLRVGGLMLALLSTGGLAATPADEALLGRWNLTLPDGTAGWLEVKRENGWYSGSILWSWGSVLPVGSVTIADETLTITRLREVYRRDAENKIVVTQQYTDTLTGRLEGDVLKIIQTGAKDDGTGFTRAEFSGRRSPPLPPAPDLAKVEFGPAIALLNGRDLSGWQPLNPARENFWRMEDGVLINAAPERVPGQPRRIGANLRTEQEFTDFNLTLEVRVPPKNNSGIYLRGIYEIQVFDSYGKPVDSHNMGALYSRITPVVSAERPPGEWQSLDITLVQRHLTVKLNGTTIIDNQPVAGCTGGALWSDDTRPGPIYLQGDHGAVEYRNLMLRPVE